MFPHPDPCCNRTPDRRTATVSPSIGVGDELKTYINGVGGEAETIPPYTVDRQATNRDHGRGQ